MATLITKLQRLVRTLNRRKGEQPISEGEAMPSMRRVLDDNVIRHLMHMIENTHAEEYSCEDTFAVLDEYVEMVVSHKDAVALMPLVKRHLDMCVDCREEYEALMRILQEK